MNKSKAKRPKFFHIRADDEFWDALDIIQVSERPVKDRTAIVKEMVLERAARLLQKAEARGK